MPLVSWGKGGKDKAPAVAFGQRPVYEKLPQGEATLSQDSATMAIHPRSMSVQLLVLVVMLQLALAISLLSTGFYVGVKHSQCNQDIEISRQTAFFSPALQDLTPHWSPRLTTQHLLLSNESIWRQPPSDVVDLEWERVTDVAILEITRRQLLKLGKDPASAVRTPPEWVGSGENREGDDERYLAIIDGMHLLHCFNSMRKSLYHNYHFYFPNGHPPSYGAHLSHCQGMLAHWLMCQPSMEFVTFGWYERRDPPFPDFDITHKCVDFEQILDWQNKQRIQDLTKPMFDAYRAKNGTQRKPSPVMNDEILDHTWDSVLDMAEQRMHSARIH
ncbi:hypothetical protein F4808DRAFT_457746 [Astrocystis sublimbata]|nr:hypothetical protein F4808DRAFT_457746 [Astrocystis sublimbata]